MKTQRTFSLLAITVAVVALPLSKGLVSQTAIEQVYDGEKQVTVKGMLVGSAGPKPPHSIYLLVSTRDARNNVVQWAVEGDSIDELRRRGYKDDSLTMGEVVT